ncbi:ABC transporter ATP-binding protein [Homoserinimonas sp. OAct 916]|uniref:ABC transporter ATP-binding protein n=1 Tax=Homoserinimonas sp. OAct 916 TaxID=2211450 RepID=UPI000DBE18AC|nr:ABC transporter ATP-binding protein [Homoserinimonas sp. OAct 916]
MPDTAPAIECESLRVRRGKKLVLHGITVTVPCGQVVGLLGPSGGGKTTLMRSIVGVQRIASGSVQVLGLPSGDARLRRLVGYSTQAASIYDDLTVRQNLSYFRSVLGARAEDIDRVLQETALSDTAGQLVATLSGGQRSRVSLAVAMLSSPPLLVLDEPTVGLDPVLREDLWNLFHDLARGGSTLLVSSHVMDEATRCDRLLLMRDGDLVADLTPSELLARTGAATAEEAFLAIIRQHPKHRAGGS